MAGPASRAAPQEGEGILAGITVVDVTGNYAGPFATLILADLGARVIKIERPGVGDDTRSWAPVVDGVSAAYGSMNRGKESVALDIRSREGCALLRELLRRGDVLVQSLRPGRLTTLGLDWQQLHELNPRLVFCDVSAFGNVGPRAGHPGYDAVLQAFTGLIDLTGYPNEPPARVGTGIVDFGTGLWAALGVLAGLLRRGVTGTGMRVEATLLGSAASFMMHHLATVQMAGVTPARLGTAQHNAAPYEAFHTRDGLVMVAAANDRLWSQLCELIDDGRLAGDPRFSSNPSRVAHRPELHQALEELTRRWSSEVLVEALLERGVPASPVRSVADFAADEQLAALQLWEATPAGRFLRIPVGLSDQPARIHSGPPRLGEHTRSVAGELGLSTAEIDRLTSAGTLGMADG